MKIPSILLAVLLITNCSREAIPQINLLVTGHGGAGFDTYRNTLPPNTLEAMNRGYFIEGADALEMDVQITRDSILVLFHDKTLDMTTGCRGCVSDFSFAELSECAIGTRNGPANGIFTIPTLEEVFKLMAPTGAVLFLNIKSHDPCVQQDLPAYYQRFARELSRLIQLYSLYGNTFVETYDLNFLLACRSVDSSFRFIYDLENFEAGKQTAIENHFDGFAIVNENVTAEQIEEAHQDSLFTIIWGVRILSATKTAVGKKPDAIMTDDIRMLQSVLNR